MSDPENFLTRWSRRKRGAGDEGDGAERHDEEQRAPDAPPAIEHAEGEAPSTPATSPEPAFDLSTLPSIESITAETDIRAFLAPGVPADLRLAALRRAWVSDPKVRDFVGLNDYDFDFHTPGAIPGFGSLEMTDELRREVAQIVGAWQRPPESTGVSAAPKQDDAASAAALPSQLAAAPEEINAPQQPQEAAAAGSSSDGVDHAGQDQDELIGSEATTQRNKDHAASQQEHSPAENLQTLARRGHGGALPK